ncbi:MAG TPA: HNH nuclease family protein [Desulfuromonadales bacterium]|nr:HNH nuclease family protein [Desulfuromonadales bacterium]
MMKRPKTVVLPSAAQAAELVKKMRGAIDSNENYRSKSLRINGAICAKCGREFDQASINLLTVHHKDGNHNYNPPDGSNWENLCTHCHDDEHSRGVLGEYLSKST